MKIDHAQIIKDCLTMPEVLQRYGYELQSKDFVCCPFHSEKTPSMKVHKHYFYCFGCGENGTIISNCMKCPLWDFRSLECEIQKQIRRGKGK